MRSLVSRKTASALQVSCRVFSSGVESYMSSILSSLLMELSNLRLHSPSNSTLMIIQFQFRMENQQIAEVVKKFDNFVHFSLTRKEEQDHAPPANKVDTYLREMEKRLKLRPRSHEQKFEKLLKPMKELKSFVSVKEFMEGLGTYAVVRVGERADKAEQALKLTYENLRGGFYMERVEQHLRNKRFKRSTRSPPFYVTELEEHSLETSDYRAWVENTLSKIPPKNDQFFKKTEGRMKEELTQQEQQCTTQLLLPERDCLMEEHQKEYADQFKVVPHMRELCTQEYESFAKISTLLTGRLRKILKNNCTSKKGPAALDNLERREEKAQAVRRSTRTRERESKENLPSSRKGKKRVQTAGAMRREESDNWREMVTSKLRSIINQSGPCVLEQ